jgi:c-di-GMP-binding flagellar brake protein YcgR
MLFAETIPASERRKYPRLTVDLPVKCIAGDESDKYGRTINASEGGLLVLFPEEMEIGERLPMQLFFVLGCELNILEATVKVVWKGALPKRNRMKNYRTGVTFLDVSPEHMTKLKNLLLTITQKPALSS